LTANKHAIWPFFTQGKPA